MFPFELSYEFSSHLGVCDDISCFWGIPLVCFIPSTRRRLVKEKRVPANKIEKLLDVFPRVIGLSGKIIQYLVYALLMASLASTIVLLRKSAILTSLFHFFNWLIRCLMPMFGRVFDAGVIQKGTHSVQIYIT